MWVKFSEGSAGWFFCSSLALTKANHRIQSVIGGLRRSSKMVSFTRGALAGWMTWRLGSAGTQSWSNYMWLHQHCGLQGFDVQSSLRRFSDDREWGSSSLKQSWPCRVAPCRFCHILMVRRHRTFPDWVLDFTSGPGGCARELWSLISSGSCSYDHDVWIQSTM